jgi:preprotein translocase subunit SecG
MTFLFYLTMTLFIIVSIFLILLILIQKGRGGGLASAFGGAGGNTAFGSKTGDVLTWATSIIFGIFILLAMGLNLLAAKVHANETGQGQTVQIPEHPNTPNSGDPATPKDNLPEVPTPAAKIIAAPSTAPTTAP